MEPKRLLPRLQESADQPPVPILSQINPVHTPIPLPEYPS